MNFAIMDRNMAMRVTLVEWLNLQVTARPEDRERNRILTCGTVEELLPLAPSVDAVWLEATANAREDVAAIRAQSRMVRGAPRPLIVLMMNVHDPELTALAFDARLIPAQKGDVDDFLDSYNAVVRLLKQDPPQPEQVFVHT
jgi:hypothetical protein